MINNKEIIKLKEKGISIDQIESQIQRFKDGFKQLDVVRAATANDGIRVIDENETSEYSQIINNAIENGLTVSKFVPASGAASRMFKDLYQYIDHPESLKTFPADHPIVKFIELLPRFAFFPYLVNMLKVHNLSNVHVRKSRAGEVINAILHEDGLNYGNLPKGLIHFHQYKDAIRTPMEEHLAEGCNYALNKDGMVKVHFTVSPEHQNIFKEKLYSEGPLIENKYEVGLDVSFSFQKPHTDTIAVTSENEPFRDEKGALLFRPGGHGALIENLNEIDADIIFVKNIDNVVPEHLLESTVKFKKALGGMLLKLRNSIHELLEKLENNATEDLINEIQQYIKGELFASLPEIYYSFSVSEKILYLKNYLNRPVRVCGMVRNEGEPGGGPFWVKDSAGQESLQILESSQLNMNDSHHVEQLKNATHFNPVDLVCSTKDFNGNRFDLTQYLDPETGFISEKSYNGQVLKALELPGLWNGAMANWITLFVEVPINTFNPVKTVNDLLRPQHQPMP